MTDNDHGQSSAEKVGNFPAGVIVTNPSWGPVHAVGQSPVPRNGLVEEPNRSAVAKLQLDAEYAPEGANASGSLRFQLGGTAFGSQSRRLNWLMLDRFRAEVKGEGTLSGQDDLVFRLGLIHTEKPEGQSADRLRIRIWNAKTGRLVYDQQPGAVDNAEPSSMLTGGSLTIAPRH